MKQSKRYLDIVKEVRDMIRQEKIRPGDRIPSERELAEKLQVGRSTLRDALRHVADGPPPDGTQDEAWAAAWLKPPP